MMKQILSITSVCIISSIHHHRRRHHNHHHHHYYHYKLAHNQIRYQAPHKVCCQLGDYIWSLQSSLVVCVGKYGLTYFFITPEEGEECVCVCVGGGGGGGERGWRER